MTPLQRTRFGISVAGVALFVATVAALAGQGAGLWGEWASPLFGMFLLVAGAHWLMQRRDRGEI